MMIKHAMVSYVPDSRREAPGVARRNEDADAAPPMTALRGIKPFRREWRTVVVGVLNHALDAEIAHMRLYMQRHYTGDRRVSAGVPRKLLDHANDDVNHADRLAMRIREIGGRIESRRPDAPLNASAAAAAPADSPQAVIRADFDAERDAIGRYQQMIEFVSDKDPDTCRLLEGIVVEKYRHAEELHDWLTRECADAGPVDPADVRGLS